MTPPPPSLSSNSSVFSTVDWALWTRPWHVLLVSDEHMNLNLGVQVISGSGSGAAWIGWWSEVKVLVLQSLLTEGCSWEWECFKWFHVSKSWIFRNHLRLSCVNIRKVCGYTSGFKMSFCVLICWFIDVCQSCCHMLQREDEFRYNQRSRQEFSKSKVPDESLQTLTAPHSHRSLLCLCSRCAWTAVGWRWVSARDVTKSTTAPPSVRGR